MYVDGRAFLVLGDACEGQSGVPCEVGLYEADSGGKAPPDVDDEPVPQLGGVRLPQHVGGVVVAVGAQRLAGGRSVRGVDGAAAKGPPVLAGPTATARTAHIPRPVDRAEGRGSQGDEEPRPMADRGGDVLAAQQARADEVEGVSCVEAGAGRADGRPAVAAADEEAFTRFATGVVVVEDLAGRAVQGGGGAGEVDGVGASAGRGDLLQPAGEVRILGEADGVTVGFGELTQARCAVEGGAPVSRGEVRGDGGGLPGWAAGAARWVGGGAPLSMGWSLRWSGGWGCGSADGAGAAADAAAPQPSGPRLPCSVALAVRAPHARHGHSGPFSAQWWEKPLMTQVTSSCTVRPTGVWPR